MELVLPLSVPENPIKNPLKIKYEKSLDKSLIEIYIFDQKIDDFITGSINHGRFNISHFEIPGVCKIRWLNYDFFKSPKYFLKNNKIPWEISNVICEFAYCKLTIFQNKKLLRSYFVDFPEKYEQFIY